MFTYGTTPHSENSLVNMYSSIFNHNSQVGCILLHHHYIILCTVLILLTYTVIKFLCYAFN